MHAPYTAHLVPIVPHYGAAPCREPKGNYKSFSTTISEETSFDVPLYDGNAGH